MDMKLCKRVSKFKMYDSKAGPWECPNQQFFVRTFLTNLSRGCFDFFDMINIDIHLQESLKFEIPDSRANLEACPGPTNS